MRELLLFSPTPAALAGNHPKYFLLGFSAALAPKFPPFHTIERTSRLRIHGLRFVEGLL